MVNATERSVGLPWPEVDKSVAEGPLPVTLGACRKSNRSFGIIEFSRTREKPMTAATSSVPVRHEQLHIRGLRIHAQICGDGEPLLLYSGIWGQVGLWERLLPHLRGFRTIAFDPPGIGRSQMPAFPLSMCGLARFGTAVLDELGVDSAHVLGASFGGAVAQQMAFSHPGRVRRLVLVSTSFGGFAVPGGPEAFWHFIHPRSYHPERLERVAGAMFGGRLRTEPELVRSMHIKRPTDTVAALYRMAGLFGWTSLPWLWAIRHPTLVIAGDDDPVTPLVNHQVMAMLMPRARLHTVAGGGHLVLLDSADQVGPVITRFLGDGRAARHDGQPQPS
jgi:poly(3-hydroxyoctanoate) depolymerase